MSDKCPFCGAIRETDEKLLSASTSGETELYECGTARHEALGRDMGYSREADCYERQIQQLQARLDRLADYGLDARDVGDGDSNALWDRIDAFRSDPDATLSTPDVRALAEWWAGLHTLLSKLDDELVEMQEQRDKTIKKLQGERDRLATAIRLAAKELAATEGNDG